MISGYGRIAFRHLWRHKGYLFINVGGLALGLACCLLIALYVRHETHFDRFHVRGDRIYRLENDVRLPSGETRTAYTSAPYGPGIAAAFPDVEAFVRLAEGGTGLMLAHEGAWREETGLLFSDSTFFDVFSFPLLHGNPATALTAPFSIVLTEATARRYFGDAAPVGRALSASDGHVYTVTGVLADVPTTSHLRFDGLISMATAEALELFYFQDLLDLRFGTYLLLREGARPRALKAALPDYVERTIGEVQRRNNFFYTFDLVPLRDVYLGAERRGLGVEGSPGTLYAVSAIALFTLLVACVNFMNLATARSAKRAREVGVRKVVGARRLQLAGQFLFESVLLSLMALGLALVLAWALLPFFNTLVGRALTLTVLAHPVALLALAGAAVGVGGLAGSYPALVLSGFQPAAVLKGSFAASRQGAALRKALVVFQFAVSVILIAGTAFMVRQVRFMQDQRLGFDAEQLLVIDFRSDAQVGQQVDVLKAELRRIPGVTAATVSWVVPGARVPQALARVETPDGTPRETMLTVYPVDYDFLDTYGLDLVAGRAFSPARAEDAGRAFIVNEAAVADLGYAAAGDILGKSFAEWGQEGTVVGVVRDFHYTALRRRIEPMNFLVAHQPRYLTLRVETADLRPILRAVEAVWSRLVPHRPLDYQFLDAAFGAQYAAEERLGQIVGSFALLAVLIACLGLFGLAAFTAEQRTKEIGVRKVLGASAAGIVLLLSKEIARLVFVGVLVAVPVVYLAMQRWLADYAYRIELSWPVFLFAGLTALAVALLTVSYQALRAALTDPVKALRHE